MRGHLFSKYPKCSRLPGLGRTLKTLPNRGPRLFQSFAPGPLMRRPRSHCIARATTFAKGAGRVAAPLARKQNLKNFKMEQSPLGNSFPLLPPTGLLGPRPRSHREVRHPSKTGLSSRWNPCRNPDGPESGLANLANYGSHPFPSFSEFCPTILAWPGAKLANFDNGRAPPSLCSFPSFASGPGERRPHSHNFREGSRVHPPRPQIETRQTLQNGVVTTRDNVCFSKFCLRPMGAAIPLPS